MRNPTLALQLEKTHETPPSSRDDGLLFLHGLESNHESSLQTTGGLTPFRPLSGLQEIPVATREESGVLRFPSRQGLTPRVHQESNPEIPAFPGEEYEVPDTRLGEVSLALQ